MITNWRIETTGLNVVVKGRVGEWIELGGLNQGQDSQGLKIAGRNKSRKVDKRILFVKVEEQ